MSSSLLSSAGRVMIDPIGGGHHCCGTMECVAGSSWSVNT